MKELANIFSDQDKAFVVSFKKLKELPCSMLQGYDADMRGISAPELIPLMILNLMSTGEFQTTVQKFFRY
jgi:hypothetical protein